MKGFVEFKKKKIAFQDKGQGDTLILLHGFMESGEIWNEFAEVLKEQFRVIAIDLPGHGESDTFNGICTMEMMAHCVKAVLDYLKPGEVILAGHSMGGYVSLALASLFPSLIKGLVLFHSGAHADSAEAKTARDRAIHAVNSDHVSFAIQFIPSLFAPQNVAKFSQQITELQRRAKLISKEAIIASLEGMKARNDYYGFLVTAAFPVLFIAGSYDSRIPYELIKEQSKIPAESEYILLENSGHMGYIEEKSVSMNALLRFCSAIR